MLQNIIIVCVLALGLAFIILYNRVFLKDKIEEMNETNLYEFNSRNAMMFKKELDNMINMQCSYNTDILFSKKFRVQLKENGIDISAEELQNLATDISNKIIKYMSDEMKTYLYITFGQLWIHDYVNMRVTYKIIEYTSSIS